VLVEHERVAAVELRSRDEELLRDVGREVPTVELVLPRGQVGPPRERKRETVPLAPGSRAQEKAAVAGEARREPARREDVGVGERLAEPYVSRRAHKHVGEPPRVEAAPDRPGVAGLARDDRRSERLEPVERLVELVDDAGLELGIAVRALLAERLG
jgi:hypothetical protein